jgi:uncharacterized protein (TIGR00725 family)
MNITVFGGSRPNEADYDQAYRLGKLLGADGHTVLTGGYIGTMEASSRGVVDAGGHAVGVTCDEIEAWRPVQPNPYIKEERRFACLRDRLFALIEGCDAAIALPGGPGTLAEIAMMWSHLLTGAIKPRKLILVGPGWKALIETMYATMGEYTPQEQRKWLLFAPDGEQAFELLSGG